MRTHLLLFLSLLLLPIAGQTVLSQDLDAVRRNAASGNTELERTALVDIRNIRTEEASHIALPLLKSSDEIVRASAAGAVIFLPATDAVNALAPLLSDRAEFVRQEAAYALGEVRYAAAVAPLIRTVQKDKDAVRNASLVALGKIGDPAALNVLVEVLRKKPNEDNEFTLRAAARSIGQIAEFQRSGKTTATTPQNYLPTKFKQPTLDGPPLAGSQRALATLIEVLRNPKQADDTRREAAFALGVIGDRSAVSALRSYLNDTDNYLAEIAKEALIKLGEPQ